MVKEQTGVQDDEKVRGALEECKGDIAQAIMKLNQEEEIGIS